MFRLSLFRIRAFTAGNAANFLGGVGRGGLQFMLMIWFQGIWLPQHGYSFTRTPLWAGIYMIPFMLGFVVAGPISGKLSDRYGARLFATSGMLLTAAMYAVMMTFPSNFSYLPFAIVMFVSGIGGGMFASPNTASIMNSVPARYRGAASGMRVTFAQTGLPLSMGLFFTLLVFGLNDKVPSAMLHGLVAHGVPVASATQLSHLPPLGYIFAAFLGYNPLKSLLGPAVLNHLPAGQAAAITGRSFFPKLIGPSFKDALVLILSFAVAMCVIAAIASALRGQKFIHVDEESIAQKARLHHGHGLRVHHDRDGKAVPDPVASAAEAGGANGAPSAGELIGSAHPSPNAPAARE
jgi:MFS family permease